ESKNHQQQPDRADDDRRDAGEEGQARQEGVIVLLRMGGDDGGIRFRMVDGRLARRHLIAGRAATCRIALMTECSRHGWYSTPEQTACERVTQALRPYLPEIGESLLNAKL